MRRTMVFGSRSWRAISFAAAIAAAVCSTNARGQLVVTELMNNPLDFDDVAWEWMEVQNTGAAAIDLDGYYSARFGQVPSGSPAVNGSLATNTVIPAGATAVLYRGDIGGPGDYDDQAFRDAWGLSGSVPLVAVENWTALTNTGGAAVGFWPASGIPAAATADNGEGLFVVDNFTGAQISIDYRTENDFTASGNGFSLEWSGNGLNSDGLQWAPSDAANGATTSVTVNLQAGQLNSTTDAGSPGSVPAGAAAAGLLITEIMFNPASSEPDWEWVEVYNNTASAIDFSTNSHVLFDDDSVGVPTDENITSGNIGIGETAVLFNEGAITKQNMIDAWDPGGALGVNFIGVSSFPQLGNGGDTVAIWSSFDDYNAEATPLASVSYDDDGVDWPFDVNGNSFFLTDLSADPNTGFNWLVHSGGDSFGGRTAAAAFGSVTIHDGGDVGTPGVFGVAPSNDADFDDDGDVDADDLATWEGAFGGAATAASGDADGNSVADGGDFLLWQRQYTGPLPQLSSVPEPGAVGLLLAGLGVVASGIAARRR